MKSAEEQEGEQGSEGKEEANGQARDDTSEFLQRPDEPVKAYVARILEKVYTADVQNLLGMEASPLSIIQGTP